MARFYIGMTSLAEMRRRNALACNLVLVRLCNTLLGLFYDELEVRRGTGEREKADEPTPAPSGVGEHEQSQDHRSHQGWDQNIDNRSLHTRVRTAHPHSSAWAIMSTPRGRSDKRREQRSDRSRRRKRDPPKRICMLVSPKPRSSARPSKVL